MRECAWWCTGTAASTAHATRTRPGSAWIACARRARVRLCARGDASAAFLLPFRRVGDGVWGGGRQVLHPQTRTCCAKAPTGRRNSLRRAAVMATRSGCASAGWRAWKASSVCDAAQHPADGRVQLHTSNVAPARPPAALANERLGGACGACVEQLTSSANRREPTGRVAPSSVGAPIVSRKQCCAGACTASILAHRRGGGAVLRARMRT